MPKTKETAFDLAKQSQKKKKTAFDREYKNAMRRVKYQIKKGKYFDMPNLKQKLKGMSWSELKGFREEKLLKEALTVIDLGAMAWGELLQRAAKGATKNHRGGSVIHERLQAMERKYGISECLKRLSALPDYVIDDLRAAAYYDSDRINEIMKAYDAFKLAFNAVDLENGDLDKLENDSIYGEISDINEVPEEWLHEEQGT